MAVKDALYNEARDRLQKQLQGAALPTESSAVRLATSKVASGLLTKAFLLLKKGAFKKTSAPPFLHTKREITVPRPLKQLACNQPEGYTQAFG